MVYLSRTGDFSLIYKILSLDGERVKFWEVTEDERKSYLRSGNSRRRVRGEIREQSDRVDHDLLEIKST